jgi:hypothetical protein
MYRSFTIDLTIEQTDYQYIVYMSAQIIKNDINVLIICLINSQIIDTLVNITIIQMNKRL